MTDLGHPETLFATAGQYRVAYRMSGAGPPDVVMTPGLWSHMELIREDPGHVNFRRRMQSFSRQIGFDSLGTGLSNRPTGGSAVEYWIQSCAAVLDAARSPAAVIVSLFGSAPLVLEFLNRYPQRCSGLVFINTHACWAARPGYTAGAPPEEIAKTREFMAKAWGRGRGFPSRLPPARRAMRNSFGGVPPYSAPWPHPALCWRALPNSKHLTRATYCRKSVSPLW